MRASRSTPSLTAGAALALPSLPGYHHQTWRDQNHKNQTWGHSNGVRLEHPPPGTDKGKFVKALRVPEGWRSGSFPDSTTREVFMKTVDKFDSLPAWDALDRHVLRFYGNFKEAVVETNLENYRVRRCTIFFYLEDDTCHITEPRRDNSGCPQGTLIRRHRFPAPAGRRGYVGPEDLKVGGNLEVYGKCIHIIDCDGFTREYYQSLGQEQPPGEEHEVDPFTATRACMKVAKTAPERTYDKLYREVLLGGGHINADQQQFMENDRRVCRFFAVHDDLDTPQYERRPFTILYFLSNDTVEIREQYPLNCGRDNFPIFFRRGKMPRDTQLKGPLDPPRPKGDFIEASDLSVGVQVQLAGRQYFIYDADDFTRLYYKEELGTELEPKKDVRLPERRVPCAKTPPYTGYGSWDDSLGSVLQLIPKKPKKDFVKLFTNEGKILRFVAQFKDAKPEDAQRRFVISYNLSDDTVAIHEPPQRNLGIVTGKFLEKGIHLNQVTGQLFTPQDLLPGNEIKVMNRSFQMLDMDEYTRKYAMQEPAGAHIDLCAVLEKVRESMRQQFPLVRDIFRRFDSDHNGVITVNEFKQALQKFSFMLKDEEVVTLMKHFDKRQDGQISYNEFCDALLDEDVTLEMLKTKPEMEAGFDAEYAAKAKRKGAHRSETEKVRRAVREIGDALYKQFGLPKKLSKEIGHMTHLQKVTCEQLHAAFMRIGHTFDLEDVQRCVIHVMGPEVDLSAIDYVEFVRAMITTYQDTSASR